MHELDDRGKGLVGWTTTPGGSKVYDKTDIYTFSETSQDIDLYPVTVDVREIIFDNNAGTDYVTYTPSISVIPGNVATKPSNPTRTGYTFKGWYTDLACTTLFDWNSPIEVGTEPFKLYAGWEAQNVNFVVFIWGEVMDENGNPYDESNPNRYQLLTSYVDTLKAGTEFTEELAEASYEVKADKNAFDYRYYDLITNFSDFAGQPVKGDGSSIYNIYFDLKEFTLTYKIFYGSMEVNGEIVSTSQSPYSSGWYSITAKLGQDITELYPTHFTTTLSGLNGYYWVGWQKSKNNSKPTTLTTSYRNNSSMGTGSVNITKRHRMTESLIYTSGNTLAEITYYIPRMQSSTPTYVDVEYYLQTVVDGNLEYIKSEVYSEYNVASSGGNITKKDIIGYTYNEAKTNEVGVVNRFYYDLNAGEIEFYNYNSFEEEYKTTVLYGEDISWLNHEPNRPIIDAVEGIELPSYYTFQGWYTNQYYQTKFEFDNATMPAKNLTLYAYWKANDITITFDANGGTLTDIDTQVIPVGSYATQPSDPIREGYEFLRWGTDSSTKIDFSVYKFEADTTIYAYWASESDEYTIKYYNMNGDLLYADTNTYRLGAEVTLQNTNLSYVWKIGNTIYSPGDIITIEPELVTDAETHEIKVILENVESDVIPELENVQIKYHSNYPTGLAEETREQTGLFRNAEVMTLGEGTFSCTGYVLVGWNTSEDGNGTSFDLSQPVFTDHNDEGSDGYNHLYAIWERQTTEITVNKLDKDGMSIGGAKFRILLDGSYDVTLEDSDDLETDENESDGKVVFTGLIYGSENVYTLTEVEAPTGYYRVEEAIRFYIGDDDIIHILDENDFVSANGKTIDVINLPMVTLPKTGGSGVYMIYIIGIGLMTSAIILLKFQKRKN